MFRYALTLNTSNIPKRATSGSAGYDICSAVNATIQPHLHQAIETGLVVQFPSDHYARIAPRSGIAYKNGIDVLAGVIDSDYRGTIKVILVNHGTDPFDVAIGDRIAQLIFEKISIPELIQVQPNELNVTHRGDGGFGSTGSNIM